MNNEFILNFSNKVAQKLGLRVVEIKKGNIFRPTFIVMVTTRCNFHCPHCLRDYVDKNKTLIKDLSPKIFEVVLREGKKVNFSNISFTGGEPILSPHFPKLVDLVKKYNYTYNFTTNGWFYKEYWPVIEKSRENLDVVLLSIDGATAEVHDRIRNKPGSFDKLIECANFFRQNKIPMHVTYVILKQNYHQIEEIADLCLELGINTIKYAAVLTLDKSNDYALSEEEKFQAFEKISFSQKNKNKINFVLTANLVGGKASDNRIQSPTFCTILNGEQLFIDHDGAMFFCCDLYKECGRKALISELGFEKCLKINFDVMNEIKKRHANDLLNNALPKMQNFCDFCNDYFEKFYKEKIKNYKIKGANDGCG